MEKDPATAERLRKDFVQYERSTDDNFKSRRPKTGATEDPEPEKATFHSQATKMHEDAETWAEHKFVRRYRYAHLRNKKSVPMSIRMEDRHGLSNLKHERVKPLDKMHFPPWLAMLLVGMPLAAMILNMTT